jgi:decaprenylphospho-beta-D-erythro-pentofuranosid-2-ulose 2-reductase
VALAGRGLEAVALCGRDPAALVPLAEELRSLGVAEIHRERFDASEYDRHDALAASLKALVGRIDLVIVAAGVLGSASLDELDATIVGEQLTTNFSGLAGAMTAFAKQLRSQRDGRIVVYSSAAGLRVRRSNFVYGAAKAGLDGFALGLGDVLHASGVRILVVRPGFVPTKMTAGRRVPPFSAEVDEVTKAVLRGLESGADVVTIPRVLAAVGTLARFVPRAIWRRLPY